MRRAVFRLSTIVFRLSTIVYCLLSFTSCHEEQVSYDPSLRLTLSVDSLAFDTVFTGFGTSTRRVTLYNPNANALTIDSVRLLDGRFFSVNVDGEADSRQWQQMIIRGKDSAFIFIRAYIDPLGQNNPLIINDELQFAYNGNRTSLLLSAIGQDVTVLKKSDFQAEYVLKAQKPYLVLDTLIFRKDLTIDRTGIRRGASRSPSAVTVPTTCLIPCHTPMLPVSGTASICSIRARMRGRMRSVMWMC